MAAGGFGPYHCLWTDDAPSKPIGVTPTPWAMMPVLGLGVSQVLAYAYHTYDTALYLSVGEKNLSKTIIMQFAMIFNELTLLNPSLHLSTRVRQRNDDND